MTTNEHLNMIDHSKLSKNLFELVELIGVDACYCLTTCYGGLTIYIPKNPKKSKITKTISIKAVELLSMYYGGTYLEVPKVSQFTRQIRNRKLLEELKEGKSKAEIAKKYDLTIKQINNISLAALD